MTVVSWSSSVNQRFFSFNKQPLENTKEFSSTSGRKVSYLINTKAVMQYSFSLKLRSRTEEETFWEWYNNALGGTAGVFTCGALGSGYFRFSSIPMPADTDQIGRVLTMQVEDVF